MNNLLGFVAILVLAGRAIADGLHDQDEMRIARGVPVGPQERLYQVLIARKFRQGLKVCSGIVIEKNWVMTTSSCYSLGDVVDYYMYVGTKTWYKTSSKIYKITFDVNHTLLLPLQHRFQLDAKKGAPFLVMLYFTIGLPAGTPIEPAKLAYTLPKAGELLEIAGWGATGQEVIKSGKMRKATVHMISDEDCRQIYAKERTYGTEFCAGLNTSRKASADFGDEGSPLVKNGLVYGLLSRVKPQGDNVTSTSLYLPFAPYKKWIDLFTSGRIRNFLQSATVHCLD